MVGRVRPGVRRSLMHAMAPLRNIAATSRSAEALGRANYGISPRPARRRGLASFCQRRHEAVPMGTPVSSCAVRSRGASGIGATNTVAVGYGSGVS